MFVNSMKNPLYTKPLVNNSFSKSLSFKGTTRIYALTDSHQYTRDKCILLSKIIEDAKKNNNVLALDCGDLFKGIYPRELEVESYIEAKKVVPNLEIAINIGNNDPGFNQESFEFFKKSVKQLDKSGIHVISANIWDKKTNERIDGIKPYAIIDRDGDRAFVTGFCINNLTQTAYGVRSEDSKKVLENLKDSIKKEKPDSIIILNHDWFTQSEELAEFAKKQGIKIDLLIGGHEHEKFEPNIQQKIYYPEAFNRSMYSFDLVRTNEGNSLRNIQKFVAETMNNIEPRLESRIKDAEERTHLLEEKMPSVIDFTKRYSQPCSLGTFLADTMKELTNSDVGFFSTGFLMASIPYKQGKMITQYDLKKTMTANCPVEKVELTPDILKAVFENALKNRMFTDKGNARFLQCSQNIKLVGIANQYAKTYTLKQIYVNNEALLDELTGEPLEPNRIITCAIDPFIGSGGQGYNILKSLEKEKYTENGTEISMNAILENSLLKASKKYPPGSKYPQFEIIDL